MKTLLIPVELCEYVLKNKLCKPFQLYVLLKALCDGKMRIQKSDYKTLAGLLNQASAKAIKNKLKKLKDLNWIGYNPKSEYYFIRGFDQLRRLLHLPARTAVEFDVNQIHLLQPFAFAAVAGYVAKDQQKKRWMSGFKKRSPNQNIHRASAYDRVASTLLQKKLNWSLSTVHDHKRQAQRARFIDIISHFDSLNTDPVYARLYKKAFPENAARVRIKDGTLQLQQADEIIPLIRFSKRKKIETVKNG